MLFLLLDDCLLVFFRRLGNLDGLELFSYLLDSLRLLLNNNVSHISKSTHILFFRLNHRLLLLL